MIDKVLGFFRLNAVWLAVAVACLGAGYVKGCTDGRAKVRAEWVKAERKAKELADKSEGQAAAEHEADTATITEAEERRNDAITKADDGGKPSASSVALNCERLRNAGADLSNFPACRRREGGGETASRP